MTPEEIYNLFQLELDGETFDSDEDAEQEMNIAWRNLLSDRNWVKLKKTQTLSAGETDLTTITDLDKVLKVWAVGDGGSTDRTPLIGGTFDDRFNLSFDYWIDHVNQTFNLIGDDNSYEEDELVVDYKYKPDDLALEDENDVSVFPAFAHPIIAYDMILAYKEKDENPDFYQTIERKRERLFDRLVLWNEQLEDYAESQE